METLSILLPRTCGWVVFKFYESLIYHFGTKFRHEILLTAEFDLFSVLS